MSLKIHSDMLIGTMFKHMRKSKNVKQHELSKATGINQSYLSRIELGKDSVTVSQLSPICNFLGYTPTKVLSKVEDATSLLQTMGVEVLHGKRIKEKPEMIDGFMETFLRISHEDSRL